MKTIFIPCIISCLSLVLASCSDASGDRAGGVRAESVVSTALARGAMLFENDGNAVTSDTAESEGETDTPHTQSQALSQEAYRSLLERADYLFLTREYEASLAQYQAIFQAFPDDIPLEKKIARTQFALAHYADSAQTYDEIPYRELSLREREQYILALLYTENSRLPDVLDALEMPADKDAYFRTMHLCLSSIHNCVVSIRSYTGTGASMNALQTILDTYDELSDDIQYRNVLLAGAILQNTIYSVSGNLAEEIISSRPDYQIALKIGGHSYYRLGNYRKARDFFHRLYVLDPKNTEVSYLLGMSHFHLGDPVTSNLYLNTAILNGYTPKTALERQLIHNYHEIGDTKSMMKVFAYLLDEEDATPNDYRIAVWTALEERILSKASKWARNGIKRFPEDAGLYALSARIEYEKGRMNEAKRELYRAFSLDRHEPLALLVRANIFIHEGKSKEARLMLERVIRYDENGFFADTARDRLAHERFAIERETAAWKHEETPSANTGTKINTDESTSSEY